MQTETNQHTETSMTDDRATAREQGRDATATARRSRATRSRDLRSADLKTRTTPNIIFVNFSNFLFDPARIYSLKLSMIFFYFVDDVYICLKFKWNVSIVCRNVVALGLRLGWESILITFCDQTFAKITLAILTLAHIDSNAYDTF